MAEFPVDPMLAKMIIQSQKYGVSGERCATPDGRAHRGQACRGARLPRRPAGPSRGACLVGAR